MVTIRLARAGAKKKPYYRVVVADQRFARDGRFVEQIGTYDPRAAAHGLKLRLDRVDYWTKNGAQPSETVGHLVKLARKAQPQTDAA